MVFIWKSTKPLLYSKFSLFKILWQMLETLLKFSPLDSFLPFLRALEWGTLWPYTSRGIKNMTSQSWKCHVKIQLLLSKYRHFTCRIIDTLWGKGRYSTSFEICGKYGSWGLSCGSASSIFKDVLKSDNLLHKWGFVDSQMKSTVRKNCLFTRTVSLDKIKLILLY